MSKEQPQSGAQALIEECLQEAQRASAKGKIAQAEEIEKMIVRLTLPQTHKRETAANDKKPVPVR